MASRLICCFVVTVLCCQVLHSWILVMDPKCLALHAVSHIRSVESVSLAQATVEVLDFIERDISGMSTTYTEEMKWNMANQVLDVAGGGSDCSPDHPAYTNSTKCVVPEEQRRRAATKLSLYTVWCSGIYQDKVLWMRHQLEWRFWPDHRCC